MNWTNVSHFCDSFPILSECPLLPLVPCTCMMSFEQHFILPSPGGKVTCPEFQLILLSTLILAIWSSAADQDVNKCEYIYLAVMPDTLFAFWQDLRGLRLLCGSDAKESACNAGDLGSIPGSGRSLVEGNGYPLQCSCWKKSHGQRSLAG